MMAGTDASGVALEAVAEELYALRPQEFTAARTAAERRARSEGDRELAVAVKALRRPAVAAWVVNLLVRERRDLVTQVVELGASLRDAQASLEGDALRELTRQRRQLVAAVTAEARAVAAEQGESLGEAAARQVEETLQAAMTDRSAADAVLTGLLTQPLSTTGLDTVSDLLAVPGAARSPGAAPSGAGSAGPSKAASPGLRLVPEPEEPEQDRAARQEVARVAARRSAEERVARAGGAVRTATAAVEAVRRKQQKRQAKVLQLENELEELRRRVAELEEATDKAAERLTDLDSRVDEAEAELADAQAEADAAREARDELD
jgi:hypothetical protein